MSLEGSKMLYFDNAATSWPKPTVVAAAMHEYMTQCGIGFGRSSGRQAEFVRATIEDLRRRLAALLHATTDEIILTTSATDGLNLVIQGLFLQRFGAKTCQAEIESQASLPALVVTTQIEHNSVLRPLQSWERRGWIRVATLPCDAMGQVIWGPLDELLQQRPLLLCVSHVSNVTGVIQSLDRLGERCHATGTLLLVDAAQSLGCLPVDVQRFGCDFLLASGHKGLHGPLGTGVAYIRRECQSQVDSLRLGGTGSFTNKREEELSGPTKWEAGNLNVPGLIGLAAAARERPEPTGNDEGLRMNKLAAQLWDGLGKIPEVTRIADPGNNPFEQLESRLPIISITVAGWAPASLAVALESAAGVVTRAGYHCAPLIHSALGSSADGTLRFSLGPYNTVADVEQLLLALENVCRF
ncbi:MAG: aminotransferase class V-fold PLP-dependent enzyme [Pirellulaceae bacterium]|nr:aminotransferase class V-fold PLP-dependent enzyme [Pirellulaceae bacterium]